MGRRVPRGAGVRVLWNDYGRMRFEERLAAHVSLEEFSRIVATGNTKKKDEEDPNGSEAEPRYRRWVNVKIGERIERVRVILFVRAEATESDPGAIEILNVMIVNARTGR